MTEDIEGLTARAAEVDADGVGDAVADSGVPDVDAKATNMTAAAIAMQQLDEPVRGGWIKVVAPAKVNLFLGIGQRRDDGYHQATSVLHAMNLHDIVYVRAQPLSPGSGLEVTATVEGRSGIEAPQLESRQNIAHKAVCALGQHIGRDADEQVTVRIIKNIPFEAGLGGGSSDAAATLVGTAQLWGLDPYGEEVEAVARSLGSDVAFFLRGGCGYYEGTGEVFVRSLSPAKTNVVLVKPSAGVSTAQAYRLFDENPVAIDEAALAKAASVDDANEIELFNNLASASEVLMPQLADIRQWLLDQPGVSQALLCGSGSTTFALCNSFAQACTIVSEASKQGWWARATSLGSIRASVVS